MAKIIPTFKFSRIFLLSLTFLIFITFIVVTIFSSFIFNNSRIQQIESLYIQAKTIDTLIPQIDEKDINFDEIADSLSITDSDDNELRITIINEDWQVIGDSLVEQQNLSNVELHSPENRIEIRDAINSAYGSATRNSETTGEDLIYVAILRDQNDLSKGIIRVALPFDLSASLFNFFIIPFIILFFLVVASSSFLSLNVENSIRRDLSILLNNTQRALKGKPIKRKIRKGDEQLESISNTVNDISNRLNAEIEQTIDQRIQFGTVLDSINQGVIIFNKNYKVRFANDIALEIFGKHQFFLGEKIANKQLQSINKLLKKTKENLSAEAEMTIKAKSSDKNLLLSATTMPSTNEYILVINDISSLRKLENLRKNLLTDISHEIKTPVSVIRAGSETLNSGALEDKETAKKFTQSIQDNAERLSEMIEDLLELEKIEFSGLVPNKKKMNVLQQINIIIDSLQSLMFEKNIQLDNLISSEHVIKTDKDSFRTILSNLIANAIKYSPDGSTISLKSSISGTDITIEIADEGYGIEKQNLNRVFDRFYRTDKARAHTKGTGLGLSLVKQLTNRLGGNVSVESKINKGSKFFVRLPQK
jgi:two-component system phosphate regulon sensor histidine kinase PhoR